MMVNTLAIARELKAAELPVGQAEAIAAAIRRSIAEGSATKADLEGVKRDLKTDIERLRTEVERGRNQLLVWIVSSQVALAGLIVALIKL